MKDTKRISSKTAFTISFIVALVTILSFWIFGLRSHRSVVENALLATLTLSAAFFLFLFVNLYRGTRLQENLGKITDRFDTKKLEFLKDLSPISGDGLNVGDEMGGIFIGVLLWILVSIFFGFMLWFFGAFLWFTLLLFVGMLYWIFYRATKLVLKNANQCKGQLDFSLLYAFGYTAFYVCWIFGIIYISVAFC
jgi:hypothetical protein